MAKKNVPVQGYKRTRLGKTENVKPHQRKTRRKGRKYNKSQRTRVKQPGTQLVQRYALFQEARYKKYNKIVSFRSPEEARIAVYELGEEFEDAKTKNKKLRVARVTQYSANRARVSARREKLTPEKKKEMIKISKIYGKMATEMWKEYRKLK